MTRRFSSALALAACLLAATGCDEASVDEDRRSPMPEDLQTLAYDAIWQQVDSGELQEMEDYEAIRATPNAFGFDIEVRPLSGGVPIEDDIAIIRLGPGDTIETIQDLLRPAPGISIRPELSNEIATHIAFGEFDEANGPAAGSEASLAIIYVDANPHLVWQVWQSPSSDDGPLVSVDAHDGEIIRVFP